MKKETTPLPMGIYSFDIETNQYYNYESWFNPKPADDVPQGLYNVVAGEVAKELCNIPADGLSGYSHVKNVYKNVMASDYIADKVSKSLADGESKFVARDRAKYAVTKTLDKCFPIENTKCEVYLGCFVYTGWTFNGKPFYMHTAEEFKNHVTSRDADFCYSLNEIDKYLQEIYDDAVKVKAPNVIIIHNISYEFNNCIRHTKFFKKVLNAGLVDFLSNNTDNSIKNMTIYAPKRGKGRGPVAVYILDTLKLTGKGIKKLGKLHRFDKLSYVYDIIRTKADLTKDDYDYNRRDCDIALLGLYDAFIQDSEALEQKYFESGSLPISANNIISTISKNHFTTEYLMHKKNVQPDKYNEAGKLIEHAGKNHMTAEQYAEYKKTTGGGLVFVNTNFGFNVYEKGKTYTNGREEFTVERMVHPDLNSAHPSQATKRLFPSSAPVYIDAKQYGKEYETICKIIIKDAEQINNLVNLDAVKKNFDIFDNLFPHLNSNKGALSGFATFNFTNIKLKTFKANNPKAPSFKLAMLWGSKISTAKSGAATYNAGDLVTNSGSNVVTICNKVHSADSISATLTLEDFAVVNLFYTWDSVTVSDLYLYSMGPISPYLYKQFDFFGHKKDTYKKIHTAIEDGDKKKLDELLEDEIVSEVDRNAIQDGYANEGRSYHEFMENCLYMPVKGQFNGIYGCSYQSLFRDSDKLEVVNGEVTWVTCAEAYDEKNSSGIDVLQGSYIAQWSRVDIALYTALIANEGGVPCYIATDSCFAIFTQYTNPDLYDVISSEGKHAENLPYNKQTPSLKKCRPNNNNLGGMSFEDEPLKLVYTFALKILAETVGVNKDTGELETDLFLKFSGVSAKLFFKDCKTFEEHAERLLQSNGYVSRFEDDPENDESCKSRRVTGEADEDGAFELVNVDFINNNTDSETVRNYINMTQCWDEV